MSRWCVAVALLAACGRVGFDATASDAGDGDATADAVMVRPADFDADFLSGSLGSFAFSRTTPGSYIDSNRVLRYAAVDEPRFDHAPDTGEPRGLLVEGAATNLIFYSDQLDVGGDWFTNGTLTVTPNVTVAPDGAMSGDEVDENDNAAVNRRAQICAIPNDALDYVCSAYLKAGTSPLRTFGCELLNGNNVQTEMDIDLSTGTITQPPDANEAEAWGITKHANGWWRAWMTLRNNTSGNDVAVLSIWSYRTDDTVNGSVYVWGAQVEQASAPSSYIPSPSNTTTTRAADDVSTAQLGWLDPTAGSMLVSAELGFIKERHQHAACFFDDGGGITCVSRNGVTGNSALLYQGTPLVEGSTWTGEPSSVLIVQTPSELTLHDPGLIVTRTAAAMGNPYTELGLGSDATAYLDGWIRRFAYWREPLTSEERTALGVK